MNSNSTILAGIDFSDSSPAVLRHATHAAGACGAKVVALYMSSTKGCGSLFPGHIRKRPDEEAAGLHHVTMTAYGAL